MRADRKLVDFLIGLALFAVCHHLLMLYATNQWHHTTRFLRLWLEP